MGRSGTQRAGGGSPAVQAALDAALGDSAAPLTVRSARPVSTLWAGYGMITEVEAEGAEGRQRLILKQVAPPPGSGVSHTRKLRSYQIEAAFYEHVAPRLPTGAACHVPRCLGVHSTLDAASVSKAGGMQLLMTDLRTRFPNSCGSLEEQQAKAALAWLAAFHAACWGADARRLGLWPEGCYWHLETRWAALVGQPLQLVHLPSAKQQELCEMGPEWRTLQAAAPELDARLRATPFRTLTHGDFKTANLLFGGGGSECAAYDFQYVGGGSGMKDVVYLLCSGLSHRLLQQQEEALLRWYHTQLRTGLAAAVEAGSSGVADPAAAAAALQQYDFDTMLADFRLALCDYCRFMAGWGFWGNDSWVTAKTRQYLAELHLG